MRGTHRRPARGLGAHARPPPHMGMAVQSDCVLLVLGRGRPNVEAFVADVTSTPWHGRHAYVSSSTGDDAWFDKALHVSPFLSMDQRYRITSPEPTDRITVRIESHQRRQARSRRRPRRNVPPDQRGLSLGRVLWRHPILTARVSGRIYTRGRPARAQGHAPPPSPGSPLRSPASIIGRPTVRSARTPLGPLCSCFGPTPRLGNAGDRGRGRQTPRLWRRRTDGRSARARRPRLVSGRPPWVDRPRGVLRTGLVGLRRPHVALAHRPRRHAACDTSARPHRDDDRAALHRSGAAAQNDPGSTRSKKRPGSLRHLQRLLRADARSRR